MLAPARMKAMIRLVRGGGRLSTMWCLSDARPIGKKSEERGQENKCNCCSKVLRGYITCPKHAGGMLAVHASIWRAGQLGAM